MRVRSILIPASFAFGLVTSAFGQNPQTPGRAAWSDDLAAVH